MSHDHPIDHLHSIDHLHPIDHSIESKLPLYPPLHQPNLHGWQQSLHPDLYKKTDAVQFSNKAEEAQRLLRVTSDNQRNPYTYFNIQTGEPVNNERPRRDTKTVIAPGRRSDLHLELHSDIHPDSHSHSHSDSHSHSSHSDSHSHSHSDTHHDIHPTTASYKDKRIAGVSNHHLPKLHHLAFTLFSSFIHHRLTRV